MSPATVVSALRPSSHRSLDAYRDSPHSPRSPRSPRSPHSPFRGNEINVSSDTKLDSVLLRMRCSNAIHNATTNQLARVFEELGADTMRRFLLSLVRQGTMDVMLGEAQARVGIFPKNAPMTVPDKLPKALWCVIFSFIGSVEKITQLSLVNHNWMYVTNNPISWWSLVDAPFASAPVKQFDWLMRFAAHRQISFKNVRALPTLCFDLRQSSGVTLLKLCGKLQYLQLDRGQTAFLPAVAQYLPCLRRLDLSDCALSDLELSSSLSHSSQLQHFELTSSRIRTNFSATFHALSRLPELSQVYLSNCEEITDEALKPLLKKSNLSSISLIQLPLVTPVSFTSSKYSNLTSLSLFGCLLFLDHATAALVVRCSQLIAFGAPPNAGDKTATSLSLCCKYLRTVDFAGAQLSKLGLSFLVRMPQLTSLNTSYCHQLSDQDGYSLLSSCRNLISVTATSPIFSQGLMALSQCLLLQYFNVSTEHKLQDLAIRTLLRRCKGLVSFELTYLGADAQLTDLAFRDMSLPHLRTFRLFRANVTNCIISQLLTCQELHRVSFVATQLNGQGVELLQAHPKICEIQLNQYCCKRKSPEEIAWAVTLEGDIL